MVDERTLKNLAGHASEFEVVVVASSVAQSTPTDGGWLTSLDFLLREGLGGNWAGQSGGGSWEETGKRPAIEANCDNATDQKPRGWQRHE